MLLSLPDAPGGKNSSSQSHSVSVRHHAAQEKIDEVELLFGSRNKTFEESRKAFLRISHFGIRVDMQKTRSLSK